MRKLQSKILYGNYAALQITGLLLQTLDMLAHSTLVMIRIGQCCHMVYYVLAVAHGYIVAGAHDRPKSVNLGGSWAPET